LVKSSLASAIIGTLISIIGTVISIIGNVISIIGTVISIIANDVPSATSAPGLGPRLPPLRRDSPQIIPELDSGIMHGGPQERSLQFSIRLTCRPNARLGHNPPEACMQQLLGVGRNHTASRLRPRRSVRRTSGAGSASDSLRTSQRTARTTSPSLQNTLPNVAWRLPRLVDCAMTGAAFARFDEDAESALVGVVTSRLCYDMLTNLCIAGNLLAFSLGASSRPRLPLQWTWRHQARSTSGCPARRMHTGPQRNVPSHSATCHRPGPRRNRERKFDLILTVSVGSSHPKFPPLHRA
jgi:hypothetical protein